MIEPRPPPQPWYEVASSGDGISPESVNIWTVPPTYLHGSTNPAPVSVQDPTKWNGDHVLNGGNKEWAEEDAALHAYNMESWRTKILETQAERQKKQWRLQNTGQKLAKSDGEGGGGGSVRVTPAAGKKNGKARSKKADGLWLGSGADGGKSLRHVEHEIAKMVERDEGGKQDRVVKLEKRNKAMLDAILGKIARLAPKVREARRRHHGRRESDD